MRALWVLVGGVAGLAGGAVTGFCAALVAMSLGPPRGDGTYGMREMLICLPAGVLLGIVVGVGWGLKTRLGAP